MENSNVEKFPITDPIVVDYCPYGDTPIQKMTTIRLLSYRQKLEGFKQKKRCQGLGKDRQYVKQYLREIKEVLQSRADHFGLSLPRFISLALKQQREGERKTKIAEVISLTRARVGRVLLGDAKPVKDFLHVPHTGDMTQMLDHLGIDLDAVAQVRYEEDRAERKRWGIAV